MLDLVAHSTYWMLLLATPFWSKPSGPQNWYLRCMKQLQSIHCVVDGFLQLWCSAQIAKKWLQHGGQYWTDGTRREHWGTGEWVKYASPCYQPCQLTTTNSPCSICHNCSCFPNSLSISADPVAVVHVLLALCSPRPCQSCTTTICCCPDLAQCNKPVQD